MKFAEPFWLLAGLARLSWRLSGFIAASIARQRAALADFASSHLLGQLTASFSTPRRAFKRVLFVAARRMRFRRAGPPAMGLPLGGNPAQGHRHPLRRRHLQEHAAQDVKPDRLTRAKLAVTDLVGKLDGDRVGLIAFAGDAFLQSPLTLDYDAFRQSLDALDAGIIPRGGTDVASAIHEAQAAFGVETKNQKILVLITDGEDLEAKGIDAAKAAAKDGLKIYTIGVGSTTGELIPVPDDNGGTSFLKDDAGNYVKSHLDESTLKQIAEATGALYAPLGQQGQGLETVYQHALAPLPKQDVIVADAKGQIERFQWPLAAGHRAAAPGNADRHAQGPVQPTEVRAASRKQAAREDCVMPRSALALGSRVPRSVVRRPRRNPRSRPIRQGDYPAAENQYQEAADKNPQLAAAAIQPGHGGL